MRQWNQLGKTIKSLPAISMLKRKLMDLVRQFKNHALAPMVLWGIRLIRPIFSPT